MSNKKEFKRTLNNIFGFRKYLNDLQEKAVENVFEAKRDVFIRGFGKSLCYQLPVMMKDNSFIIVISSNISYIKRHHEYFKAKNIKTNYLTSNTSRNNRMAIEKDILTETSSFKILFITPLKYESGYFKTILKQINKQRLFYIVIEQTDNIIAQQEHIKRPYENLDLKIIRVPIIAISGTANAQMEKDIITKFHLLNPKIYAMPVLRSNLYHDIWYINTLPEPLVHLRQFIENCFSFNNATNSVEKETWGVIVCKDLGATISMANYLTSIGIPTFPHATYILTADEIKVFEPIDKSKLSTALEKEKKHFEISAALKERKKYSRNDKEVKVITVCDDIGMLTVTNSPDQIIDKKLVRFVVYWCALPSIQKYYSQLSQARYGISYCRIYCQLEEFMNNDDIISSFMQIQCRHKVYSEYCGDTFFACRYYCDVCKKREEVEEEMNRLMEFTDNEYLENKLRESLEFSKNSARICDKTLQYECSKETFSSQYQTKNIESKETRKSNGDRLRLNTNIQYIEENNNKLVKKSQASSQSSKETVSSGYQIISIESEETKESSDNHPSLDTQVQYIENNNKLVKISQASSKSSKETVSSGYQTMNMESEATILDTDIQCVDENDQLDRKSQAELALCGIYKNLFSTQESTSTRSFSIKSVSSTSRASVNKSKKSNNRNRQTKTRTIEVITIDDETSETEEGLVQNITVQLKENVPNNDKNDDDDDIIFIKESRKRRRSQTSRLERKKRRT